MDKEKGAVEGLKDKLYSRANKGQMQDVRSKLSHEEAQAPVAWKDMPERERKPLVPPTPESRLSFATRFFIVSIGFFLVALVVAAIAFFWGPNTISPANIDIQLVAPSLVDAGKEMPLQIVIDNKNPAQLQLVDLVLDYPDGSRDPKNPTQPLLHERQSIGTIDAATQIKRTSSVLLYGQEGQQETIRATLEYSVAGSSAIFTRTGSVDVTIGSSPVSVTINTPSEAIAGQSFPIDVVVRSNATTQIDNVIVQGQLPFGYVLQSSTPQTSGGTLWKLGSLTPGQSQTIHLDGTIDGQDGDTRIFKFVVGQGQSASDSTIGVPLLTMPATVTVSRPFISGTLSVNSQTASKVSAQAGSTVEGAINWQNNLTDPIQNVEVRLTLDGPMIDKSSINAGTGFYDSSSNSIVWTSQQDPNLANAAPGATGQLSFSFGTLPPGQGGVVYTNPTASLKLSISATRPGQGNVPGQVTAAATTQVTFASALGLTAQVAYLGGPRPPVVNQSTTYSITWAVKNSSNAVGNTTVSTVLPPYVQFVSGSSNVAYDSQSRTVTWTIGDLRAGVGYTSAAQTASFQIGFVPSTSQVGQAPNLTGSSALSGVDRFASTQVQSTAPALTTVDNVSAAQ